jgi:tetratricopeptide (TPR) repeat protein
MFGTTWPRAPKTPFAAGVAALEQRRVDEALAHFATALASAASDRERALVHNKRGLALLVRGDRNAAVAAFVAALDADDRCAPAIVNVGNLLLEDGILNDAVAHYEAALAIDDASAAAHLNLGIAQKRLGRRTEAVREFRRAAALEARQARPRRT